LRKDIAESKDVAAKNPKIVSRLMAQAEAAREELGDSLANRTGSGNRPAGNR
jgi:hypothetical protein